MRRILYLMLSIPLCCLFFSCNDDDNDFTIHCTGKQIMREGVIHSIYTEGGSGDFTVVSSDESIATLERVVNETDKKTYYNIKPHSKGKVTFTVYDGNSQNSIELMVVDPFKAHSILSTHIAYITQGPVESPLTKEEIEEEGLFAMTNTFILQKDEYNNFYLYKTKDEHMDAKPYIAKGSFNFEKINDIPALEITVDKETYHFRISGERNSSISYYYSFFKPEWLKTKALDPDYYENIVLTQNITEQIMKKYPQSGIVEATIDYQVGFLDENLFLAPLN